MNFILFSYVRSGILYIKPSLTVGLKKFSFIILKIFYTNLYRLTALVKIFFTMAHST